MFTECVTQRKAVITVWWWFTSRFIQLGHIYYACWYTCFVLCICLSSQNFQSLCLGIWQRKACCTNCSETFPVSWPDEVELKYSVLVTVQSSCGMLMYYVEETLRLASLTSKARFCTLNDFLWGGGAGFREVQALFPQHGVQTRCGIQLRYRETPLRGAVSLSFPVVALC